MSTPKHPALDHIRRMWGENFKCPVCDHSDWAVSDKAIAVRPYPEDFPGEAVIPLFPIFCNFCGNTMFLSGVSAGAFPPAR